MIDDTRLKGQNIYLRHLQTDDDLTNYSAGINNRDHTNFIEAGKRQHTVKDLQDYISSMNASHDHRLFGIFSIETGAHIGNVTLDDIDMANRKSEVGILLWMHQARGFATEAINLLAKYAFTCLNLNKLYAGAALRNQASVALFKKCGFEEEGVLKMEFFKDGEYHDVIRFRLLRQQFNTGL